MRTLHNVQRSTYAVAMPRKGSPYGPRYEKVRAAMLGLPCELRLKCSGAPADSVDHDPPLSRHTHVEGAGCCRLRPACMSCQSKQAITLANETRRLGRRPTLPAVERVVPEPSRVWA